MPLPHRKLLSALEVVRICGMSDRSLRLWTGPKDRDPFRRTKRGGRWYYDPDAFLVWLESRGKVREHARFAAFLDGVEPSAERNRGKHDLTTERVAAFDSRRRASIETATREAVAAGMGPVSRGEEIVLGATRDAARDSNVADTSAADNGGPVQVWDIFGVRDQTARMYTTAVQMFVTAPAGEQIALQKNALAVADLLRKLELDAIEVAKQMRLVILVADAERLIGRICARVKHDLMNLPHSLAADLAEMANPTDIAKLLDARVTDALRHLSEGLRLMDADE